MIQSGGGGERGEVEGCWVPYGVCFCSTKNLAGLCAESKGSGVSISVLRKMLFGMRTARKP